MLVLKEMDGVIYAADMGPSLSAQTPGDLIKGWTPIGPGRSPVVTWDAQGCFVTFDYLDHVYVRRMDTSVWPPQVIDPVTVVPGTPVSIQEPHDAIGFQHASAPMGMFLYDAYMAPTGRLKRTKTLYYDPDTDTYLTAVTRDNWQPPYPLPATRKKWRVYIRELGDTSWTILQDWIQEVPELVFTRVGSMKLELMCTYGHLWTREGRNCDVSVTGDYIESPAGPILTINSDLEGKTRVSFPATEIPYDLGMASALEMEPKLRYGAAGGNEAIGLALGGSLNDIWLYMGRPVFQAVLPDEGIPYTSGASGTALLYS